MQQPHQEHALKFANAAFLGEVAGNDPTSDAVVPEIPHIHKFGRNALESGDDRGRHHQITQRFLPDQGNSARERIHRRRQAIPGAVGQTENCGRDAGIQLHNLNEFLGCRIRLIDKGVQPERHIRQAKKVLDFLDQLLG